MRKSSSWGTARRRTGCAAALLVLAAASPAGAAATGAEPTGPCALADRLREAGLLTAATERYHAIKSAAQRRAAERRKASGGRAPPPRAESPALVCARSGLRDVVDARAHRAARIRAEATRLNAEAATRHALAERLHRSHLALAQTRVAEHTIERMEDAATLGMADQIPHLVGYAIHRDDRGRHGLAIARVLRSAGYPLVAASVAADTLAAHPAAELPPQLMRLVGARRSLEARRDIARARAFVAAGLDEEAKEAVRAAIEADPTVHVPDEVASPTRALPFWNRARGRFGPWLRTLVEILIAALALVVLALLLARLPRRFRLRIGVDPFTGGPDEAVRSASAAAVRENYGRLMRDGGHRLKYVNSSGESFEAVSRQVAEIYKPAGVVASLLSLIDRLVPARTRRLGGQLRVVDPQRGAGLTVTFGRRYGKVFDETTLWESDYGRPVGAGRAAQSAYDRVALPASAWVTYAAAASTLPRGVRRRLRRMCPPRFARPARGGWGAPFRVLGTDDWRSYAHFVVGADLQARGALSEARLSYERALGRDPRNRGAAFNLGVLEQQDGLRRGRRRLKRLRRAIGDDRADELWFRVRYAQTIGWLESTSATRAKRARDAAVGLCAAIVVEREALRRRLRNRGHRRDQAAFLDSVLPSALLLLASALHAADARSTTPAAPGTCAPALTWTRLLDQLRGVTDDPASIERFAAVVTHARLAELVVSRGGLDPPALYNRVCYDARLVHGAPPTDRRWAELEEHLHEAIRHDGPRLAAWASRDPALAEYRLDLGRRQRLIRLRSELRAFGAS